MTLSFLLRTLWRAAIAAATTSSRAHTSSLSSTTKTASPSNVLPFVKPITKISEPTFFTGRLRTRQLMGPQEVRSRES